MHLSIVNGDKQPIGGRTEKKFAFTTHNIDLQKNDCIYLFSDGYIDQFGGSKGKKLKQRGFKELLLEMQTLSMQTQKEVLMKKLADWKGELEQVDDILVIGVRI